jgi:hypothetical protein
VEDAARELGAAIKDATAAGQVLAALRAAMLRAQALRLMIRRGGHSSYGGRRPDGIWRRRSCAWRRRTR